MTRRAPTVFEFTARDDPELLSALAEVARSGTGWINLEPVIDAEFEPPGPGPFAFLGGSIHKVPVATWLPGRRLPDGTARETSLGLQHAAGPRVARRLRDLGLSLVLFNAEPGHWAGGDRGLASLEGREADFRRSIQEALARAQALDCPLVHVMAGLCTAPTDVPAAWARYEQRLAWAAEQGIPTAVVDHKAHADREAFDAALAAEIDRFAPDLVLLAGFMRILTPGFVRHYDGRLLNIHPSLLPQHPGLHTHRRVLQAGESAHGANSSVSGATLPVVPVVNLIGMAHFAESRNAAVHERGL